MIGPVIHRLYYSTSEVCQIVRLKPHILTIWEKRFPACRPSKNKSGRKLYKPNDLNMIIQVKKWKADGFSDEDIDIFLSGGTIRNQPIQEIAANGSKNELIGDIIHNLEEILDIIDSKELLQKK